MKSQKNITNKTNLNHSFSVSSQKTHQKQSLPKLTISFDSQQYYLPIHPNSSIKKLALELLVMLYDELLEQELNEGFREVHQTICELLVKQVKSVIQKEENPTFKEFLIKINREYAQEKEAAIKQVQNENNKYFLKNYINTMRRKSSSKNNKANRSITQKNTSTQNLKLYQKAQKSIEKKIKLQKQNAQQKSKTQISYCTFHPNISKSQKKFKSKEKSNVFQRLYNDAEELKMKSFFKKKQVENEEQKMNLSYKFIPQINECSKQIAQLKGKHEDNDKILFDYFDKSQISFQTSQNSSQKYLKEQSSKKVFQKLYDTNFYENRFNKTIQKINNENKQNSFTFQPELSAGTKRITQHYPRLQKRMKIYQIKKPENPRHSPKFEKSKDKSSKKLPIDAKTSKNQCQQVKQKKGIRKMLDRIKTEPLGQLDIVSNNSNHLYGISRMGKYNSQVFQLDSDFIEDKSMFQITPKKLNLQPPNQKTFFKNKPSNNEKQWQHNHYNIQNDQSPSIMKQIQNKEQIFDKIFSQLSMGSDQITARNITSNRNLPKQIKEIFQPLTNELSQMDTELDKEEFIWSLQNLYEQLQIEKKAMLLSWGLKLFKLNLSHPKSSNTLRHVKTEGSIFQLIE